MAGAGIKKLTALIMGPPGMSTRCMSEMGNGWPDRIHPVFLPPPMDYRPADVPSYGRLEL